MESVPPIGLDHPTILAAALLGDSAVTLQWTDPNDYTRLPQGILQYEIEQSVDGGPFARCATCGSDTTSISISGKYEVEISYAFRVFIVLGDRKSTSSDTARMSVSFQAPTELSVTSISKTHVELSWQYPEGFQEGFKIERRSGSSSFSVVSSSDAGSRLYLDSPPDAGLLYTYRVFAYTDHNTSLPSPEITISWVYDTVAFFRTLTGHTGAVSSLAYSPDGGILASGSFDGTIRLWNTENGLPIRTLTGHSDFVRCVRFSPDGSHLASGGNDATLRLWKVSNGALDTTVTDSAAMVFSISYSPDGSLLACATSGSTKIRDLHGVYVRSIMEPTTCSYAVCFSPNGNEIATGSSTPEGVVRLWNKTYAQLIRTFSGHTDAIYSLAFAPNALILASASADNTVKLWVPGSGSLLRTLTGHTNAVMSIAFSNDGSFVASASADNTLKVWRTQDGKLLATMNPDAGWVNAVAFSPDGTTVASGASGIISLWQVLFKWKPIP